MGSSSLHHHQFEDLCQSCFSILDKTQIKALDLQRMGDTYTVKEEESTREIKIQIS